MFSVLGDVKGLIKLDKLCIDNNVFRLHYKVRGCEKKGFQQSVKSNSIGLPGNLHHLADSLHPGHSKAIYGLVSTSVIFADIVFLPRRRSN